MIEYSLVPLHLILDDLKEVTPRHHKEVSDEPLNIDWDTYKQAGETGQAVAVTARDNGILVGYIIFTLSRNLRFMHVIEASSSGWYVEKEYRNKVDMISKADEFLKNAGIHETSFTVTSEVGSLLHRKGYGMKYQVWEKKYGI